MKQGRFSTSLDLNSPIPIYLSLKEIWRSKTRFLKMMDGRVTRVITQKEDIVTLADLGEQETETAVEG